jgi:predicted flap endonuclease-1-like 5' DNA nuclease
MEFIIGLFAGVIMGGMLALVLHQLVWAGKMTASQRETEQKVTAEVKDLRGRLRFLSGRYSQEQRRATSLQTEVAVLRTRLEATAATAAELTERLRTAVANNEELWEKLSANRREIGGLQARLDSVCDRLAEEQRRQTAVANKGERLQATLVALSQRAGQWAAQAVERQAQLERLQLELERLQPENELLRQKAVLLESAAADLREKATQLAASSRSNDAAVAAHLQSIRGIGPVYARRLHAAGIHTFTDLLAASPEQLRQITGAAPWQGEPEIWIAQARQFAGFEKKE